MPLVQAQARRLPQKPATANDRQNDFLLQEHTVLQQKMQYAVEDLRKTEITIPLAIGVFYAWIFKDGAQVAAFAGGLYAIPVVLALFGLIRHNGRQRYIAHLEAYFMRIESHFTDPTKFGWENYYRLSEDYGRYRLVRGLFWLGLVIATVAVAIIWGFRLNVSA